MVGSVPVALTDYGIEVPMSARVLWVTDGGHIELQNFLRKT